MQTTLVNFCVTEKGLEDQLLALVVEHERPDLQEQAQALVTQLGEFTITLVGLEDNLLTRLAAAQGDILEDIELIENLEETKRTAVSHPRLPLPLCWRGMCGMHRLRIGWHLGVCMPSVEAGVRTRGRNRSMRVRAA